jgi:hypothetical protein
VKLARDDGAVVYINGVEVVRSNLPQSGTIASSTLALSAVGGADETTYFSFPVQPSVLTSGINIIAVEVHQASAASSDLGFDLELSGTVDLQLVRRGSVWKYRDTGEDLGTLWRQPGYGDVSWAQGTARLGYGGDGEVTSIRCTADPVCPTAAPNKHITTYFRRAFAVTDPSVIGALALKLQRDDGAVVYLNGTEVMRSNMPNQPAVITAATLASSTVGGLDESAWYIGSANPSLLVSGTNVLAVEVHQRTADSSDLGFDLELDATLATVPAAPSALQATAPSGSQVNLAWTDNANDESGFKIERTSDGLAFQQVGSLPANTTSFSDTQVLPGAIWCPVTT